MEPDDRFTNTDDPANPYHDDGGAADAQFNAEGVAFNGHTAQAIALADSLEEFYDSYIETAAVASPAALTREIGGVGCALEEVKELADTMRAVFS